MVHGLRELAALAEDWVWFPEDWVWFPAPPSSLTRAKGSDALFWPLWALHACGELTYTQAKHS